MGKRRPSVKATAAPMQYSGAPANRDGLKFSVGYSVGQLRRGYTRRLSRKAAVYITAVLEYCAAELVDLATYVTDKHRRKVITCRDVCMAIRYDADLSRLCKKVTVEQGGVRPMIHPALGGDRKRPLPSAPVIHPTVYDQDMRPPGEAMVN
eukprot:TRINITY_DN1840_c7_g1_i1.p2 TRINITY_DN1840_c7_g1~~TRINITY_DN1840_c7_g1_i1.p2  ORF type:complete len:151 (+),score=20.85 TRINITY_DN1840_c7_g1_i1:63-515(+)